MTTTDPRTHLPTDRPGGSLARIGGVAALVEAATFLVGIAMFATVLGDYTSGDPTPAGSVAFLVDHRAALFVWHLVTLIVFAVALVPLALAVHQRLTAGSPGPAATATAFGLIWSGLILATGMIANIGLSSVADLAATDAGRAETVWATLDAVTNGLGGGNEVAGGVWVLLVSLIALRTGALPRALNWVGIAGAAAGLATVVPGLEDLGMVFGLGLIVWFTWLGVVLLRSGHPPRR